VSALEIIESTDCWGWWARKAVHEYTGHLILLRATHSERDRRFG